MVQPASSATPDRIQSTRKFWSTRIMTLWARFEHNGRPKIGAIEGDTIADHGGDIFAGAAPSGERIALKDARLKTPCDPSKMICLWNNFPALAAKLGVAAPDEPLYLLKAPSSFLAH